MGTLFDITEEFRALYEMGADPECDEEAFQGTLESLMGEIEVKGCGYTQVIKQLEMEQKQAEEVSKMFADKATVRKNHIKRMKEALKMAMETIGTDEIPAGAFTIKLQNNGGVEPLVLDQPDKVPDNLTKITVAPDSDKIREFLEGQKDRKTEWAHIAPRGQHIVIK